MAEFKLSSGQTLSYHDSGSGYTILFLHSFGHNKNLWFPQFNHFLERGFRVLAPDMFGHGESSFDPEKHSVDLMARAYIELLDELGIGQTVVAGISMGGYIALRMWDHRSDLISALVMSNTKAEADTEEIVGRRRTQIENINKNGLEWFITNGAPKRLSPATLENRPWVLDIIKLLNWTVPAEVNAATLEAMAQKADDSHLLSGIDVPALVIAGGDDTFIPQESPTRLHEGIKGSRFQEIPDTGHVTSLEAPSRFNQLMEEFLNSAKLL